jgi:hypothetical protein
VFENRVLRRIFGLRREEVSVGLIPQPRSPTKCLWIEKSVKEGQSSIRTVEASGKKKKKNYI